MFHVDLSSQRAKLALRFFTYGVMTISTIVLTGVALLFAMGYRFNQDLLSFEQGGLLQFRSSPSGAAIYIDGKLQSYKTPGRANLPVGQHTIEMRLGGYKTWRKTVDIAPGQLLWLNYARLIPDELVTTPHHTLASLSGAKATPDRKFMLLQERADKPGFILADLSDPKKPLFTPFTLPDAQLNKQGDNYGQFSIAEWDLSSRFALVRQQLGATVEYIRIDRGKPHEAVNISKLFRLAVDEAHFAGSNPNVIFAKTGDVLRRLDVGANNASVALVTGLRQFVVYGDNTVAFVAERETVVQAVPMRQLVAGILVNDKETIAKTYPTHTPLKIAFSKYFQHSYVAVYDGGTRVQVLRDPTAGSHEIAEFATVDFGKPVEWLSFNASGRLLTLGDSKTIATFDIELGKTFTTALPVALTRPAEWLDDFYLWFDTGDGLRILEFDGQNGHEVARVQAGATVLLSHDGRYLFSFNRSGDSSTVVLQATRLVEE